MNTHAQVLEADLTWTGQAFEPGVQVTIDAQGRITAVGRMNRGEEPHVASAPGASRGLKPAARAGEASAVTKRLEGQALLPGMVNVHSHAFQRALRGRGETFPQGAGSFWTWREAMYGLVEELDADTFYQWSRRAFEEMLACGITTVGEFHYFRHEASEQGYAFDDVILQAAHDSGIRLVLLPSYYKTGGVGKPLAGGQRRFACTSPDEYWRQWDRLAGKLRDDRQTLGASVHSIRAAGIDDIVSIHRESSRRGLAFHMHVEEQRQEIADCVAGYGKTPMALLNEKLEIDSRFTAIHCTHTDPKEMQRFAASGGKVCLCPLTEGNLGDGVPDVPGIRAAGGTICLGSDSNARISTVDEMRWLEYGQRLRAEKRGVCVDQEGSSARALFQIATINGADSLGIAAGSIEIGQPADLVSVDLRSASLAGWTPETLLDVAVFGTGENVVSSACVGGIELSRREAPVPFKREGT